MTTEQQWEGLCSYCDTMCHHLLFDLRGRYRIRIVSGMHDGKFWLYEGRSWSEVVTLAVQGMMPEQESAQGTVRTTMGRA